VVAIRTLTAFHPGAEKIGEPYLGEVLEHLIENDTVLLHTSCETIFLAISATRKRRYEALVPRTTGNQVSYKGYLSRWKCASIL